MYRLINTNGGAEIGVTEKPRFIKESSTGVYIEAAEKEAEGVAYKGTAYNLQGRNGVGAEETTMLIEFDGGDISAEAKGAGDVAAIGFVTLAEAGEIDDATAGEHAELFSPWESGVKYEAGNLRKYGGQLYRCIQAHTSQADWTPDAAVSLWVKAADPAEEWPEWSQPVGAADAYDQGAKVSHNGKHWTSDVAANVWEPGVYGWTEV